MHCPQPLCCVLLQFASSVWTSHTHQSRCYFQNRHGVLWPPIDMELNSVLFVYKTRYQIQGIERGERAFSAPRDVSVWNTRNRKQQMFYIAMLIGCNLSNRGFPLTIPVYLLLSCLDKCKLSKCLSLRKHAGGPGGSFIILVWFLFILR